METDLDFLQDSMVLLPSWHPCAIMSASCMELPSTQGLAPVSSATSLAGPSSRPTASPAPPSPPKLPVPPAARPAPGLHGMWTHVKGSITVPPAKHLNLSVTHTTTLSPIPKNYRAALEDPNWLTAMQDEYNALVVNKMWNLIPRPAPPTSSSTSGSSSTSSTLTAPCLATRLVGSPVATPNSPTSTMMKCSVWLSNWQ
jgi:hypothetical protein